MALALIDERCTRELIDDFEHSNSNPKTTQHPTFIFSHCTQKNQHMKFAFFTMILNFVQNIMEL